MFVKDVEGNSVNIDEICLNQTLVITRVSTKKINYNNIHYSHGYYHCRENYLLYCCTTLHISNLDFSNVNGPLQQLIMIMISNIIMICSNNNAHVKKTLLIMVHFGNVIKQTFAALYQSCYSFIHSFTFYKK